MAKLLEEPVSALEAADVTFLHFVPSREAAWRRGEAWLGGGGREDLRVSSGDLDVAPGWLWEMEVIGFFDGSRVTSSGRGARNVPV